MIDREKLLSDLKGELPKIETDILNYSERHAELGYHLEEEYNKAVKAGRTAEHFVAWREAQITQAAAAWVLTCVFVRFLEDNGLLDEPMLSGPVSRENDSRPLAHAKERITHYFGEHPAHAEREYLLALFRELDQFPVIDALLDPRHNPLWQIPVSDDGAKRLVDFFQRIDPEGGDLVHDFTDTEWDTRFLGDLYQDLSESVRKRYALLQTPEFVEEFILDYTLTPAIETFGLEELRLIDPTCGSGHFLLTTFERVFDVWQRREPATNARHLAQKALNVVHGVDINPYAVAVAKFRLLIAALKAAGSDKVRNAPDFDFHLAVGDSLLHGKRHESEGQGLQLDTFDDSLKHAFETEDLTKLDQILGQRYHVVVGNPPYITVKDKVLNQAYRIKYPTCHMKYSLGVPFTERFFDLTLTAEGNQSAGFVGMITANSFMKREFGKKLIEEFLPKRELTHVIDTSGAYIPGHGTPTVILFARNCQPRHEKVRAILGIQGEPGAPDIAAEGKVWRSIVSLLSEPGSENKFVSCVEQQRSTYSSYPWSLSGGGAIDLKQMITEKADKLLGKIIQSIGFSCITGEDNVYVVPEKYAKRVELEFRQFSEGDTVRDWVINEGDVILFPYHEGVGYVRLQDTSHIDHYWRFRSILRARKMFGKSPYEHGLGWGEIIHFSEARYFSKNIISFAFVATHNHFVLGGEGKVFNRSAPVIKLPEGAVEDEHLSLLGLLNSSIACFWMKQVFYPKGGDHVGTKGARVRKTLWDERYEHTGAGLKSFPVVNDSSGIALQLSSELNELAQSQILNEPRVAVEQIALTPCNAMEKAFSENTKLMYQMISIQEELDWFCYRLYGVIKKDLCYQGTPPPVKLGERAFEIALARRIVAGDTDTTWFERHRSTPITEIPDHWPVDYRELVERRLQAIEENRWVNLVEQPEFKRRWNREPWEKRQQRALKEWLLDRMEEETKVNGPELITGAQLADRVRHDEKFQQVAKLYTDNPLYDAQQLVTELIAVDEVPQLAPARLKPSAMKKFRAWQETWDKQRMEDAIDAEFGVAEPLSPEEVEDAEKVKAYEAATKQAESKKAIEVGIIPVPPKYAATDFRKGSYWSLRGKLDVPKERFFSLPGCEKPGDSTPVIGWAGLDQLQRAQAIAGWYVERKDRDGWESDKLMPMLVALEELIPWLKQWHNELDPEYGERMGEFYEGFLFEELRLHGLTRDDLLIWQPPVVQQSRRRKTTRA
ncbi:BREX-2 system adenine-specific DNA-methyltransferase PglX [Halomonas titanicae]|uniref:BREX-2 system adenine-specific DNA-methyltransferase PglX n=1 Tax=Vreelandella titanicae TaxID=664683 RepID=UPI001F2CA9A1|nr:BREX-2 system adenine-specific DNA-methyltransferase PglX [Halomonas titanicae]MCE7517130.1 BREX-2 system adenine-specific DNA-methyltransferase PglX [Halomonas titanicae]